MNTTEIAFKTWALGCMADADPWKCDIVGPNRNIYFCEYTTSRGIFVSVVYNTETNTGNMSLGRYTDKKDKTFLSAGMSISHEHHLTNEKEWSNIITEQYGITALPINSERPAS